MMKKEKILINCLLKIFQTSFHSGYMSIQYTACIFDALSNESSIGLLIGAN